MSALSDAVESLLTVAGLAAGWLAMSWVATAVHELGHALGLWMAGGRLYLLVIGIGPGARLERPGFTLGLGLLPAFGCCIGAGMRAGRWRMALYLLAGPAANGVAAAAAGLGAHALGEAGLPALTLWGAALLNAWDAVTNLLPAPGLLPASDGTQLLALWRRPGTSCPQVAPR